MAERVLIIVIRSSYFLSLGTVTTQSPSLVVVMVLPLPDAELAPVLDVLLVDPLPEFTVTDGPPVVELFTPPGPAVTELDRLPGPFASSVWTTRQGLPLLFVTVVLPETPFGPVVTVLVWAWLRARLPTSSTLLISGRIRRSMVHPS